MWKLQSAIKMLMCCQHDTSVELCLQQVKKTKFKLCAQATRQCQHLMVRETSLQLDGFCLSTHSFSQLCVIFEWYQKISISKWKNKWVKHWVSARNTVAETALSDSGISTADSATHQAMTFLSRFVILGLIQLAAWCQHMYIKKKAQERQTLKYIKKGLRETDT